MIYDVANGDMGICILRGRPFPEPAQRCKTGARGWVEYDDTSDFTQACPGPADRFPVVRVYGRVEFYHRDQGALREPPALDADGNVVVPGRDGTELFWESLGDPGRIKGGAWLDGRLIKCDFTGSVGTLRGLTVSDCWTTRAAGDAAIRRRNNR